MTDHVDSAFGQWTSFFGVVFVTTSFIIDVCTGTIYRQILDAKNVTVCRKPLYYSADTLYVIRAHDKIYSSNCEIKFLDWNDAIVGQPCVSLCVRVHNNSMKSCDFKMTYYDGLGDLNSQSFDCHSFPPILWCSRKNEIKIAFTEEKKYKGSGYDITLEVTSYCSQDDEENTDDKTDVKRKGDTYHESKRKEEKRTRDTVIIAGSLVSTVSFILVICWVTYCCWKRKHPSESSSSNRHTPGSATSTSTPKSDGSCNRPCQYSACATVGTTTQQFYPPSGRQYLQQKNSNPYNNSYNYPQRQNADRYVQFPDSGIDMKETFVQFKPQPQTREPQYTDDRYLGVNYGEGGHSYDADEDSPGKDFTPPVPPRPNMTQYQAKQYFI